ncbi:hypothetical protein K402DRAFT_413487 [Aulographum hederae CBS 113979]|uniref:RNA exonuclease 4 n=1 Tax=Aulographum hederae CBS 113979 TaxID=1176131 RepID=A0A6G1GWA6_9PEZI|nr:hypothetical protein K402DRAFT_413487 [Aulographum hederae CBS 113979]
MLLCSCCVSSNWKKLKQSLEKEKPPVGGLNGLKRKRPEDQKPPSQDLKRPRTDLANAKKGRKATMSLSTPTSPKRSKSASSLPKLLALSAKQQNDAFQPLERTTTTTDQEKRSSTASQINCGRISALSGKYVALDCEMVGIAPDPNKTSQLARVSIVNYHGDLLYDSFVLPHQPVLDYRTHVSGVTAALLRPGYARPFSDVQKDVADLLKGKILVGHAIRNDIDVLMFGHPRRDVRDTSRHASFRQYAAGATPSLKKLAREILGWDIQAGEHSSIEDARATMALFQREKESFEREHVRVFGVSKKVVEQVKTKVKSKAKKKKKGKRK